MTASSRVGSISRYPGHPEINTTSNNGIQDVAVLQRQLLETATKSLSASQIYIPEIEVFLEKLTTRVKRVSITGIPTFVRDIRKTQATLRELIHQLSATQPPESALQLLKRKLDICAIEISHGSLHWDVLKRCRSFVSINQVFQGSDKETRKKLLATASLSGREKELAHRTMKAQAKVEVHVVEGGAEWIDIRTIHPDRLLRQMADGGWEWGEHEFGDVVDEQEWEDIPLAKQIKRLIAAARLNRHEYRIPRLRVVMPSIGMEQRDINVLLDQFSRIDPGVKLIIECRDGHFLKKPLPKSDIAVQNLLGTEFDGLTETLNMDHTILIDLISDIMHLRLEPKPWQDETTRAQIEEENMHDGLMTKTLYPILERRTLVCTKEAAEHFHEVLATVGTSSEQERGRLLVPFDQVYKAMPHADIRSRFEELSVRPLPSSVQIPITVLGAYWTQSDIEQATRDLRLPAMAIDVARNSGFKSAKLSIFMSGWANGHVTLTSNKEIKGNIKTIVETYRQHDEDYGPAIWRLDVTRNLLAHGATPREPYEYDV